jgi:hypothetical protein
MNKTEIWEEVQKILSTNKVKSNVVAELSLILAPKVNLGTPKNELGQSYCRYTGNYYDDEDMVYQNEDMRLQGKSKGYSKAGIAKWTKGQKFIKDLKMRALNVESLDELSELRKEIQECDGNSIDWLTRF